MVRRHFTKYHAQTLVVLTIIAMCAWFMLADFSAAAKVAKHRAAKPQEMRPENLTTVLYGGNGGHSNADSINDGSLVIIDQANANTTLVGHPNGVARLTGLAFDSTGKLFASTQPAGGFPPPPPPMTSTLVTINPANGALTSNPVTITAGSGGPAISIADLAVQPGTDILFGVRSSNDGNNGQGFLYTINKTSGVATFIGDTHAFFASIAFAPDGTLYETAADLNFMTGDVINFRIMKVSPANGAIINSVATSTFFGALGVRPLDGVIFGGTGDSHQIFTINPTTGVATLVGDTGQNFVGDLAFSPVSNTGVNAYRQTNLVSDIPGVGQILDPNLVNPWGMTFSSSSPFWLSDNGTGVATLYAGDNASGPITKNTMTVTIPGGKNTGVVFNGSSDFVITDGSGTGPARFIFDTEGGTVAAWKSGTTAITKVTTPNAVYKGLAIGNNGTANFLYAANFNSGKIDVFDKNFAAITLSGSFTDPSLPAGYAPFNIQNLGGKLFVTYALQDADKEDDVPGAGHGFVNTFDFNGNFLGRFISMGTLNSPWGITLSPASFGQFGAELLVGNFGDGRINAFNPANGAFLGTLNNQSGTPLLIDGLWALNFGNGGSGGDVDTLYFSAGTGDEDHGIFGKLQPAAPAGVLLQFSSATYTVNESGGSATITVTRTGDLSQTATVKFATFDGTASQQKDYVGTAGTLSFAAGEVSKTFSVLIVDDAIPEADETVNLILSNPTGAGLGSQSTAVLTIKDNDSGAPPSAVSTTRSTAGANAASIQAAVDQFRADLGGANNGVGGTFFNGRREINWDGVPDASSAPNNLPANFFNSNSPRGVVFSTPGDAAGAFQVSAKTGNPTNTPVRFGNLNANYPNIFSTFSPERLFTALSTTGNVTEVNFFLPGTNIPATVSGFGSVFTDVDLATSTKIQYFDSANGLLLEQNVPANAGNGSLSFLGVSFTNRRIARVRIFSGNSKIGPDDNPAGGTDIVVMDDFIYGEPQALPITSAKTFVASLNGAQEVPPKVTNGTGTGIVSLGADDTVGKASLFFTGLTSPANAAHIHGPGAPGVNAPVIFPIAVPAATTGQANDVAINLTAQQVQDLKGSLDYMNVHTNNNPNGEIRGQLQWNPIEESSFFVRQHYLDFLNREPDAGGLSFWATQISGCGVNTTCISNRRIDVSAAFFFSQEFQLTDFFVYSVRKASFGVLPTFSQFTLDRSQIGFGSDADKKTFTEAFVQTGDFLGVYPTTLSGSAFIDKLIATIQAGSGVDLSSKKADLENEYVSEATQAASRARVLRRVVGYTEFTNVEFNRGFVAAQYYGYLKRDPDPGGFNFWLNILNNTNPSNIRGMVCAFITSAEYQLRFGVSVRTNSECAGVTTP
jgi:uncharacterized protein (TIGR03118 family)